jgi:hypothetical protein
MIGIMLVSIFSMSNLREEKMAKKEMTTVEKRFVPPEPPKPYPKPGKIDEGFVPQKPPQPSQPPNEKKK